MAAPDKLMSNQETAMVSRLDDSAIESAADAPKLGGRPPKHDWLALKRHWLTMNLDPTRTQVYSIRQLAEDHEITAGTAANVCSQQRWYDTLKKESEEQHARVLERQREQFATDEVEIRMRQQRQAKKAGEIAETAMDKLLQDLSEGHGATLPPKDIATLLRVGLEQERKAMALPDEFKITEERTTDDEFGKTPAERARAAKRLRSLAVKLLAKAPKEE